VLENNAFAAAALSDNADNLAFINFEVNIVEYELVAEAFF
jgi:hypothetical protein